MGHRRRVVGAVPGRLGRAASAQHRHASREKKALGEKALGETVPGEKALGEKASDEQALGDPAAGTDL
eukprot:COSAG01_NODE_8746_length_2671_cov_1.407379_3_plen_68_part_00